MIRSVGLVASIALASAVLVGGAFGDTAGDSLSRVDLTVLTGT